MRDTVAPQQQQAGSHVHLLLRELIVGLFESKLEDELYSVGVKEASIGAVCKLGVDKRWIGQCVNAEGSVDFEQDLGEYTARRIV